MNVRPAKYFDYKPREPVPFKSNRDPVRDLREENPLSAQAFEVAHIGNDILLDHAHQGTLGLVGGGTAAAIGLVSLGWGVARLRSNALPDKIDGIGHLALAGSSACHALDHLTNVHLPGGHALEVVHGLAQLGLGITELQRARHEGPTERTLVGVCQICIGAAVAGAGVFGHLAPPLHLVAAGVLAIKEVALNYSLNRGMKA